MNFYTSDFHFKHLNIISYMQRPYQSIEEMTEGLIKIWNDTVSKDDHVYVLGDFSLNVNNNPEIVARLNGTRTLVVGNHDLQQYYHLHSDKALRRLEKVYQKHLDCGWLEVVTNKEVVLLNGQRVLLSHMPYIKDTAMYDERYLKFRPEDKGLFLLHGHLHKHYLKKKNMIDVGIDGELKLWSEEEIIALINDEREFIPSVATKTNHTVMGDDSL